MEEVRGGLLRGKPRLGGIDSVKVAFGNRGMTVEAERQCAKDRKEWRTLVHMYLNEFHTAILLYPVFFQTAITRSGSYQKLMKCIRLLSIFAWTCSKTCSAKEKSKKTPNTQRQKGFVEKR